MSSHRTSAIDGVAILPLKEICDERGAVLHFMRNDSPLFSTFGEVYFSLILPGAVKAWKRHLRQVQHMAVPTGLLRIVLADLRVESPSMNVVEQYVLGRPKHYSLLRVPPGIWYGFQALGDQPAMIANLTDISHDPEESERRSVMDGPIEFDWHTNTIETRE